DVRLAKGCPDLWKVLLVEPWTPGHAPVAGVYQPAPVLGGSCASRPLPDAYVPLRRNDRIVGMTPWSAYRFTASSPMPSAAKKMAWSVRDNGWSCVARTAVAAPSWLRASRLAPSSVIRRRGDRDTWAPPRLEPYVRTRDQEVRCGCDSLPERVVTVGPQRYRHVNRCDLSTALQSRMFSLR